MKDKETMVKRVSHYVLSEHGFEYIRYFVLCLFDVLKNAGILWMTYFGISYVMKGTEYSVGNIITGAVLVLIGEVSLLYLNYCMNCLSKSMEAKVYKKIVNKTRKISILDLMNSTVQSDISAALEEGKNALETIMMDFPSYIGLLLQICIYVIVVCRVSWWYAPMTLLLIVLMVLLSSYLKNRETDIYEEVTRKLRLFGYFGSILYKESGHKEVAVQDASGYLEKKRSRYADELIQGKRKKHSNQMKLDVYGGLVLLIGTLGMSAYLFYASASGRMEKELLITTLVAGFLLYQQILSLSEQINWDKEALYYVGKYFDLLDKEEEQDTEYKEEISSISMNINRFCYGEECILKELSLTVRRGEKLLLIGNNGAGKTTLLNLLTGVYPLTEGTLYVNNALCTDTMWIRKRSVVVSQKFPVLKMTLRENLMCENASDSEIQRVLQRVGLWEVIERLPDGLDTFMGEEHSLSHGQWQRFAIARLLLHKEADIWVLDEPTSAMDAIHEADILKLIFEESKDKILIIVTHRLSMVKQMDGIYHMANGKFDFQGRHEELYSESQVYKEMYDAQAQMYS